MDNKFDSTYSVVNAILDKMGGTATDYDSTYSICLRILDLVEQGGGGGGGEFNPVAARAAVTLNATELFDKAIGGGALSSIFKAKLLEAIELNKILYICDKTNGTVSVIITLINKVDNSHIDFTASDGVNRYELHLDLNTDFVTIKQDKIGDPFNRYENNIYESIFNITPEATNLQIQEIFTNTRGETVLPRTGDVFSASDETGIVDSGIVISKVTTPATVDYIILSNNLVNEFSVQHHIKFNYNEKQGLDSLKVASASHITIDPSLIEHEKMAALYASVERKQDTLVSGTNIKTINNKSILGEGNITIEGGGTSIEVVDNLNSTAVDDALSANQGKVLNDTKADKSELTPLLPKTEAAETYQPIGDYQPAGNYAEKSELANLVNKSEISDMLTKTEASTTYQPIGNYIGPDAIVDMETKTHAKATYQPKGEYLTEIPAEYVTETELDAYKFATESQLTGKADKSEIADMETKTHAKATYQPVGDYVTNETLTSKNYASKSELANKQDKLIGTETTGQNIKTINGASILGTGNIEIQGGGSSIIVEDNLSSTSVTNALSANQGKVLNDTKADKSAITDMLTKTVANETYQPIGQYATKDEISDMLTKTVANETYQPKGKYLTEIPAEYVTDSELTAKDYATNTALKGKVDKSEISDMLTKTEASTTYQPIGDYQPAGDYVTNDVLNGKNYASKSDLTNKQDKLVGTAIEGQNIKTINGESILGTGNIEIQGGSGGVGKPGEGQYSEVFNSLPASHATNMYAHAEGNGTYARGLASHSEGYGTSANGDRSHVEGDGGVANNYAQHTCGCYNVPEAEPSLYSLNLEKTLFVVGNGNMNARSDAFKMLGNGTTWIAGIGDFTGVNPTVENSLQSVIANAGKIESRNETTSIVSIAPNKFYKWGEVASLNVTLTPPTNTNIVNEYMFEFVSGASATTLVISPEPKWIGDNKIEPNKTYQVSILNGIAVKGGI